MSGVASCGMSGVGLIPLALQRGDPGANVVILTCTTVGAATLTFQRLGAVAGQTIHVEWGDGASDDYSDNPASTRTHAYAGAGAWRVRIFPSTAIVQLILGDTKVSCAPGQISKCTGLTTLNLSAMTGFNVGAEETGALINVTSLTLTNCDGVAAQTGLANLPALTTLRYENGLTQAQVNSVLAQLYAAFPTRTGVNGTVDLLGDGNAAPSGVSPGAPECPPTTGWNTASELVNDSCGISPNHWASVTCQV